MQSLIFTLLRLFIVLKQPQIRYPLILLFIFACFRWPAVFYTFVAFLFLPILILLLLGVMVRHKVKRTQSEFRSRMKNMAASAAPPPNFDDGRVKDVEIRVVDEKESSS